MARFFEFFGGEEIAAAIEALPDTAIASRLIGQPEDEPLFLGHGHHLGSAWDDDRMKCLCGDDDPDGCLYLNCGYEYCPKCDDHHRPPVCVPVIREQVPEW